MKKNYLISPRNVFLTLTLLSPGIAISGASAEDISAGDAQAITVADNSAPQLSRAVPAQSESGPAAFQFYASDKTAELMYVKQGSVFDLDNSYSSLSFLFSEERDNAITGSVMFEADPKILDGLNLYFGFKSIAGLLGIENNDVLGVGVNLAATYDFPIKQFPLQFSAEIGYIPDILTFGQSDRIIDGNVRAGLPLTEKLVGFVGLRFLQFDTRPGEREVDDKVHIGFRWNLDP